jgi:hypothetical protein
MTVFERANLLGISADSRVLQRIGESVGKAFALNSTLTGPTSNMTRIKKSEVQTIEVWDYPESFYPIMDEIIKRREPLERKKRKRITAQRVK